MADSTNQLGIESRVQLFNTLAEAAELEHSLLCCYLYAIFSLKNSVNENISESELNSINNWRTVIRGVALEEMTHLTLVANLMSAIGGSPHFMRVNFPYPAGLYPSDLVVKLAPFDLETIKHFVYLERPENEDIEDSPVFNHRDYVREAPKGMLMPYYGEYQTVGQLYRAIRKSIERLADELGEDKLFCGSPSLQIGPVDSPLPGLMVINNLETAKKALDVIVTQGEGGTTSDNSHFNRFLNIEKEYEEILSKNPDFKPARLAARNPVMRKPPTPDEKIWCNAPLTSIHMDLANAVYVASLRLLVQVYENRPRDPISKRALLNASFFLMRAMTPIGQSLTYLPANENNPEIKAGMSFAMVRSLAPVQDIAEITALTERLEHIISSYHHLVELTKNSIQSNQDNAATAYGLEQLIKAEPLLDNAMQSLKGLKAPDLNNENMTNENKTSDLLQRSEIAINPPAKIKSLPTGEGIQQAKGKNISISFNKNLCIHARYCGTEMPKVFNVDANGEWIFPDQADADLLASVVRKCPSGALQYVRHDNSENESAPEINLVRIRENGPYSFMGDLKINGQQDSFRLNLCRCGQSAKKPYCDGSHIKADFQATGEPAPLETTALESRGGILEVEPEENGPLYIKGNVEICTGNGIPILKTTETRLCRCGNSKTKPLCDGSHALTNFVAEGL